MTSSPKPFFYFDGRDTDEGNVDEKCPSCNIPFVDHTNGQLVTCALTELEGGKN